MGLVDLARRAVLRTDRWPVLGELYTRAYDLGLDFTARRLGSVPAVLAVLLRANDDDRTWTPGLSDYDLSVLIERHDCARTLRILDALWRRYRSIKRLVPQLGEMEILDVDDFADVLAYGPSPTSAIKRTYPLRARTDQPAVEQAAQRRTRPPGEPELLLDALSRFSRFAYPAWLDETGRGDAPPGRRAAHLLGNVAKRLARLGEAVETGAEGTSVDRTIDVFRALTRACSRMRPNESDPATAIDPHVSSIPNGALPPIRAICESVFRRAAFRRGSAVSWVSFMSRDRLNLVFVVPDDSEPDELKRLLVVLKAEWRAAAALLSGASSDRGGSPSFDPAVPTVASESMWRSWRQLSPFEGAAIAANGRTIVGESDRLRAAPPRSALRRGAEVYYAMLLPLKNNWRRSRGRPSGESYATLVNHARGCASGLTGPLRTAPAVLELASTQEGYQAAVEALKELRARLGN